MTREGGRMLVPMPRVTAMVTWINGIKMFMKILKIVIGWMKNPKIVILLVVKTGWIVILKVVTLLKIVLKI